MLTLNLKKVIASAAAALVLTVVMSWTFVDSTRFARVHHDSGASVVAAVSALVR